MCPRAGVSNGRPSGRLSKLQWITSTNDVSTTCVGTESSTTESDTADVPAAVGVPLSVPSCPSTRPGGTPAPTQRYGERPPVAANVWKYAPATAPSGNEVVVIASAGTGPIGVDAEAGHRVAEPP